MASFTPVAPSTSDTAEPPKSAISRAPGVAPKPTESSSVDVETLSSQPQGDAKKPATPLTTVDTSGLKLAALALPHTESDDTWLLSQLQKHPVSEAPPFTLPPQELEREKALIRASVAARGEARHNDVYEDAFDGAEDEDEDVNGFLATNAGKKAKRKVRRFGQ